MISTIQVSDIRCLDAAALDLSEPVTLVLGDNGTGKSTLAAAVEYGLLGTCEWTDMRGAGYAALLRYGAKSGKVALTIGDLAIERTMWAKKSALTVGNDDGDKARGTLAAMLPEPDILRCMLRSGTFIGLPAKGQQDILFSLAGGEVDVAWFKERLGAEEQDALGVALATLVTGPALADALYKAAYDLRSEANGVVKQLAAQVTSDTPSLPPDAQTLENKLGQAVAKAKQDLAAAQEALGKARADHEAIAAAKRRAEVALAEYERATAELEALGDAPEAVDAGAVREANDKVVETQARLDDLSRRMHTAAGTLAALQGQAERLAELDGQCVVAGVICPLSEEDIESLRSGVEEQVDAAQEQFDGLSSQHTEVSFALEEAKKKLHNLNAQAVAITEHEHKRDRAIEARDAAQHRLDAANADAERPCQPIPAVQTAVDEAQAKLDEAEAAHLELSHAMDAHAAHKRIKRELAEAEARAEMLDALVKKLAEGGPLRTEASSGTVGAVLDDINEILEQFAPFEVSLNEDGLRVAHLSGDEAQQSGHVPVRLLSESEKLRVGAAIQVAFARLTGFDFVIVDAADRLDTHNRGPLLGMLLQSGVRALVTATPMNGTRPQAPGLAVYNLADGRAVDARA